MARRNARWIECPGITNDGRYAHSMRDNCWNCAPFWEWIPLCPDCDKKLSTTGYCKQCRKHFSVEVRDEPRT